jgi:prolyl 4-hydroxylase
VLWNNLRPDGAPNYDTLHQGAPVRAGYKAIVTKWFRRAR